jgi:DNA polymerase-4
VNLDSHRLAIDYLSGPIIAKEKPRRPLGSFIQSLADAKLSVLKRTYDSVVGRPVRTILHADMDAFFVSVELLRYPDLAGKPVVVGGTGNRGVVAAASYEARRFGVHSALPSSIARRRCPQAIFLPGDHEMYRRVSTQVRDILDRYTPLVEPLSLDEAFLDVTGSQRLFGSGEDIAWQIRNDVRAELKLGCCIGVASNKFLAKLASVEAKPRALPDRIKPGRGVMVVAPDAEQAFLDPLAVQRLWGVGPATLDRLHRLGIVHVEDLRRIEPAVVVAALGRNQANHLIALSTGSDDRPVEVDRDAKSIGHEETYSQNLYGVSEMQTNLVRLADAVASRLRQAGVGARTLQLKVRFDDGFHTITRSTTSKEAIDSAAGIMEILAPILETIDPSPGIRLLGVSGSNLGPVFHQMTLNEAAEDVPTYGAADAALDEIRDRFGGDAIGPASAVRRGAIRNVKRGEQQWGPNQ